MFKFLKDKLKSAVSRFTKEVEEEVVEKEEKVKKSDKKEKKPEKKEVKKESKKPDKKEIKKEDKKAKEKKPEEKKEEKSKESKSKESKEDKDKPVKKEVKEKKVIPEDKVEDIKEELDEQKEEIKEEFEEKKEKKGFFGRLKEKISKPKEEKEAEEKVEELEEDIEEEIEDQVEEDEEAEAKEIEEDEEEVKEKKGFFAKVGEAFTTKTLSESKFDDIFWELEVAMLENNVAVSVIEKIKSDMKKDLVEQRLKRGALQETVVESLRNSIEEVLSQDKVDFFKKIKEKKPFVICFFGINGSGKTTSIAKLAHLLKEKGFTSVIAAADTFRAAAIDQIQKHGDNIGIKVIKHEYGADAAAVAFDAIEYAKAKKLDLVLIDTAGRSHSNANLMDELKKIIRVANPDMKIFVGDSLTGNDMVEQAEKYAETVGVDGIILAKADVDEKGGATISAAYVVKKPIFFLGSGQEYGDIEEFDKKKIMRNLGLD